MNMPAKLFDCLLSDYTKSSTHPLWRENERQSQNFWGGGAPATPILKSVIGTAGNPKPPKTILYGWNLVLFCCVFVCL